MEPLSAESEERGGGEECLVGIARILAHRNGSLGRRGQEESGRVEVFRLLLVQSASPLHCSRPFIIFLPPRFSRRTWTEPAQSLESLGFQSGTSYSGWPRRGSQRGT
jgi:hypothetical protein